MIHQWSFILVSHATLVVTDPDCFFYFLQIAHFGLDDLDEQKVISLLTDVIEKIKRENQELNTKQAHIQVTHQTCCM